jgi:hypothetical protein
MSMTLKGSVRVSRLGRYPSLKLEGQTLTIGEPLTVAPGASLRNDTGHELKFVYSSGEQSYLANGEQIGNRTSNPVVW